MNATKPDPMLYLGKAKTALKQERYDNALSFVAESLRLNPNLESNFEAAVVRYVALHRLNVELKRDEALNDLLAFCAKLPPNSVMRLLVATSMLSLLRDATTAKKFHSVSVEYGYPEFDSMSRCYFVMLKAVDNKAKLLEVVEALGQVTGMHPLVDDLLSYYCESEKIKATPEAKLAFLKALRKRLKDEGNGVNRYIATVKK